MDTEQAIRWDVPEGVTAVRVELSRDGGASWETLAESVDADAGGWAWTVTDGGAALPQADCRIRLTDVDGTVPDAVSGRFGVFDGVWYVDADAPAGGDGLTWPTAFRHPQDAMDVSFPGAEIRVAEGTYGLRSPEEDTVLAMADGVSVYGGFEGTETSRDERDWTLHVTTLDGGGAADIVVTGASDALLDGFVVTGGAAYSGSGMQAYEVTGLTVADCAFAGNEAGAIEASYSSITVVDCVFSDNRTSYDGGAIDAYRCRLSISGCAFEGNGSTSYGEGGAVSAYYCAGALVDCTFIGNTCYYSGGALYWYSGTLTVADCEFRGNASEESGGAVYVSQSAAADVTNCVFWSNTTARAGGAFCSNSTPTTFTNCTFGRNSADLNGAAAYFNSYGEAAISFTNCVLWGDTAGGDGTEVYCDGSGRSEVRYSDIRGGHVGEGNIDADPLFADTARGDLRLTSGSPCIDSADADAATGADILGKPRVDDPATADTGTGVPGHSDMGAYEFVPASVQAITVIAPDGGEHWATDSTRAIEWAAAGVASVCIEISRDGGATWEEIAASVDASARRFDWLVTDGGAAVPQAECLVRVKDAGGAAADASDATFVVGSGVWFVRVDAPADGDGLSWATAFSHPQDAMDVASSGNQVWVAAGLYFRRDAADTVLLAMEDGVAIYGGFAGVEAALDERDPAANVTTFDGETLVAHVVTGASGAVLDGFRITRGGEAAGTLPGAGMHASGVGELTVAGCLFTANQAATDGGGLYAEDSDLRVSRCTFDGNSAVREGGGAYLTYCLVDVESCVFSANAAAWAGGALLTRSGTTSLVNCVFHANTAAKGGAVYARSDLRAANCTLSGNSADLGGGILVADSPATITGCVLWDNSGLAGAQIHLHGERATASVRYSCVEGGRLAEPEDRCDWGEGNFDGDPRFADPAAGDFRLRAGSPCIDAADGDAAPRRDVEGVARHDDPGISNTGAGYPRYVDVGAHEFQGESTGTWIKILVPRAGTVWRQGREVELAWVASADVESVKIDLSLDGGGSWQTLAASVQTGTGPDGRSYPWTVDAGAGQLPVTGCLVRVSDADDGSPSATSGTFAVFGGVWHVNASAAPGGGGFSWATALPHPQDACLAASSGEEVWVAGGTYLRLGSDDRQVLVMRAGVGVYGGFAGAESARDERDPGANVTILDGEGAALHVVLAMADVTLDGFTVTGGYAPGNSPGSGGGGLRIDAAEGVTVSRCLFNQNVAQGSGGGIRSIESSALVTDCTFTGNAAGSSGGGMSCFDDWPSFTDGKYTRIAGCTFEGNFSRRGGGLSITSQVFSSDEYLVEACVFSGNTASWGAGLHLGGGAQDVVNCVFYGNAAADDGGGVRCQRGRPRLTNCTFNANSAEYSGGGVASDFTADVTITNCILWGDTATYSGDEIDVQRGEVEYCAIEGWYAGGTNIDADPLFVDAAGGDFRLAAGSPCIDAADGAAAPLTDIAGNLRVDDPSVVDAGANRPTYADIGAHERLEPGWQGICLLSPSDGQEWPVGSVQEISWQSVGVATLDVELSRDGGTTWETLASAADASAASLSWTVAGAASPECVIRVSDAADGVPCDQSDGTFFLGKCLRVTVPNGGEEWRLGSTAYVGWVSGNIETVSIHFSRDGGITWETIADAEEAYPAGYSHAVTDGGQPLAQRGCLVRVSDADEPSVFDVSDAGFAIWDGLGHRVDVDAPDGGDGFDWTHAFRHPQDAVDAADWDDEIWVAEGTYARRAAEDTSVVTLTFSPVRMYGGFVGTETARDQRDWSARTATLDGEDVCLHVVVGGTGARLDGFSITRGNADGTSSSAQSGGGLWSVYDSEFVVANCTFSDNAATASGGAVYAEYSEGSKWPLFEGCVFAGNSADTGGAVSNGRGNPRYVDCRFAGNTATSEGGAVWNHHTSCNAVFEDCVFEGNSAPIGGAMHSYGGGPVVTNCVFLANSASGSGGALYGLYGCELELRNCTFSLNTAQLGGAVYNEYARVVASNCIFWGDSAATDPEICDGGNLVSDVTWSCVQGGRAGEGNFDADPLLADAAAGDVSLLPGSPCIDAACGSVAPDADIDGNARRDDPGVVNGGSGGPDYADVGACEFQGDTAASFLLLLHPAEGSALRVGDEAVIRWAVSTDVVSVEVELSRDGGATWETVASAAPSTGCCTWTVTDGAQALPQTTCVVRVSDAAGGPSDSSGAFTIFSGVWHVDSAAPGGDGLSWATAFSHPQDAMDVTSPGDEVWVRQGTYYRSEADDLVLLSFSPGVGLYGGFLGNETDRASRDPSLYACTIDAAGVCEVVTCGAPGIVLDGFTITGCAIDIYSVGMGFLSVDCPNVTVASCRFERGPNPGGCRGIESESSTISVQDSTFTDFGSSAVSGESSEMVFTACQFSGCYEAISVSRSVTTVTGCSFAGNTGDLGAALRIGGEGSSCTVEDCVFTDNQADTEGGGIACLEGSLTVRRCLFQGNLAGYGGAIYLEDGTATVQGCRFVGNTGDTYGGGVYNRLNDADFANCVFWENSSGLGGGICDNWGGARSVTNCTFASNSANYGGAYALGRGLPVFTNCIFWGNSAPEGPNLHQRLVSVEEDPQVIYTCIEGGYAGTGNIGADLVDDDPLFVDAAAGDLHLQPGSPCVDTGDPATTLAGDIEGNPRPSGGGYDMGAYEHQP